MTESKHSGMDCPLCRLIGVCRSSEAGQHLKNARKEILLAFKAMIDAGLSRMEKPDPEAGEGGAQKVEIV